MFTLFFIPYFGNYWFFAKKKKVDKPTFNISEFFLNPCAKLHFIWQRACEETCTILPSRYNRVCEGPIHTGSPWEPRCYYSQNERTPVSAVEVILSKMIYHSRHKILISALRFINLRPLYRDTSWKTVNFKQQSYDSIKPANAAKSLNSHSKVYRRWIRWSA